MPISSVTKILESIQNSYSLTRTLGEIQLWREKDQSILYRVGNSVVLFKIFHHGEWRAMRCYMRRMRNMREIYGEKYLPEELYVYNSWRTGEWIDVVIEEWVDGVTLKERLEKAIERGERETIKQLAESFDRIAQSLLNSDCAHGDLTAENIIITPEGEMRLIDFDGRFMPQMRGSRSPEIGTEAYQPPSRTDIDFDKDIDDYSIALISTALHTLSLDESLYHKFGFYDGLLYNPQLIARGECEALKQSIELLKRSSMDIPYRTAMLLNMNTLRIAPLAEIFQSIAPLETTTQPLLLTMKYGYIGYSAPQGEVIIPHIYDDGLEFSEGVVMVKLGDTWRALNLRGEVVMTFEGYEQVRSLRGGVIRAKRKGSWFEIEFLGDL